MNMQSCTKTGSLERRNAGISLIARKMRRSFTATMPRRGKNWSQWSKTENGMSFCAASKWSREISSMCRAEPSMRSEKAFWFWRRSRILTQPTDYMIMTEKTLKETCASSICKSIEVIDVPSSPDRETVQYETSGDVKTAALIDCPYFSVEKWDVKGSACFKQDKPFLLASVIEGKGASHLAAITFHLKRRSHAAALGLWRIYARRPCGMYRLKLINWINDQRRPFWTDHKTMVCFIFAKKNLDLPRRVHRGLTMHIPKLSQVK